MTDKNVKTQSHYTGWRKWTPSLDEWVQLTTENYCPLELKNNEYLLVYNSEDEGRLCQQYCYQDGKLHKFGRKAIKADKNICINARNDEQVCAIDLMHRDDVTVKLLTGTWGSGKTMILVTAALEALNQGRFKQIIWIRNNIRVKDTADLGALPGDVVEKLLPFLGPFIDHIGKKEVISMLEKETLVIEPLQSLRGRNFKDSIIICSEAENFTAEHIKLIIARAAEGSHVWFDADIRQRDLDVFEKSKGIEKLINKLAGHKLFGYVHLIKTERSETAELADLLDQ